MLLGANRDEGWTFVNRSFPSSVTLDQYVTTLDSEFGPDAAAISAAYPVSDFPSPKDALAAAFGDAEYVCEARRTARSIERTKTPVYLYLFSYEVDPVSADKVAHGLEVSILFGNNYGPPLFPAYTLGAADLELSHAMQGTGHASRAPATPTATIRQLFIGRRSHDRRAMVGASTNTWRSICRFRKACVSTKGCVTSGNPTSFDRRRELCPLRGLRVKALWEFLARRAESVLEPIRQ